MAGESERRLQKVMDKLYHFPKPKPSPSSSAAKGNRAELGPRFRIEKGSRVPYLGALGPPPQCRPWDRGDLMRRVATFKAMTWFAKPKVISPVNCARRGWINIEIDVISCEACGARLLFSTPSSWTVQQVEKAAAVFSLKLDNGHKLLCPWIDNICEETLALFPPTPPPVLIDNFNESFSSLLNLMALPVISSNAVEYMKKRAPQLDQLLNELAPLSVVLKGGIVVSNSEFRGKDLDGIFEDSGAYYQALKIISLCGWEPHQLPYTVDRAVNVNPTSASSELSERDSVPPDGAGPASDTSSYVLDCRFCGARVALWSFVTLDRPLQLFNLTANSTNHAIMGNSEGVNVNSSIAGGPPPARQNFRPRVSFPFVSRHLKAELDGLSFGLKRKRSGDDPLSESTGEEGSGEVAVDNQKGNGFAKISPGKQKLYERMDEFDAIKQHRTFCPWISPEDSTSQSQTLPGWKLTLLALLSKEKSCNSGTQEEAQSSLLDEVDDPIASVRKLFMSPVSKKLKSTP